MNSKQFKQIRKALKLTKKEIGLELGLSEKTIYNYEHSRVPICVTLALVTLCKKKGFEVEDDLTGFPFEIDIKVKVPVEIREVSISGSV